VGIPALDRSQRAPGPNGKKVVDVDGADFDRVYAVNVRGSFNVTKHAIPHMLKHNYGRVVLIASIAGKEGNAVRTRACVHVCVCGGGGGGGRLWLAVNVHGCYTLCSCILPSLTLAHLPLRRQQMHPTLTRRGWRRTRQARLRWSGWPRPWARNMPRLA
jgi:NAD(P)-dependent dehydrogenase (short-subunit alcohol dehydrogenase family)